LARKKLNASLGFYFPLSAHGALMGRGGGGPGCFHRRYWKM